MSDDRQADLQDAVAAAINAKGLSGVPEAKAVVRPLYKPEDEDLAEGEPAVPVWIGGEEITSDQGPDWNTTIIAVGVCGTTFDAEGYSLTQDSIRLQELVRARQLNAILLRIQKLFTPDLDRDLYLLADHRFQDISRPIHLDTSLYRENGIWLSALMLTYMDQLDE